MSLVVRRLVFFCFFYFFYFYLFVCFGGAGLFVLIYFFVCVYFLFGAGGSLLVFISTLSLISFPALENRSRRLIGFFQGIL